MKKVTMLFATTTLFLAGLPAVVHSFISLNRFQPETRGFLSNGNQNSILGAIPHADLTPAVDKYARLPSGDFYENYPTKTFSASWMTRKSSPPSGPDPFQIVHDELKPLSDYVKELLVSENPVLTMAATHFFQQRQGKRFRPTIVSLLGRALAPTREIYQNSDLHKRHLQLGQITEMIHVASLIHDDVLDDADMRRGGAAVHALYTNKVAILAGDYLLARASVLLARLQHFQVVEIMAAALDALVQGEIMQAKSKKEELSNMEHYLRKSYFKTSSLICSSCKCAALLCGFDENHSLTKAAEEYGYHLGMAFQIIDDILDFSGASASLGKPAQADMVLGLATAPILFASEDHKELIPLIQRRFKENGDVGKAVALASRTDCVEKSYALAEFHANRAIDALMRFPASESRDALLKVVHVAITRDK